jgi:hypothetical protein
LKIPPKRSLRPDRQIFSAESKPKETSRFRSNRPIRKFSEIFPKEDSEEQTIKTGLIAEAVDTATSLPDTHPQAADRSMISEEIVPGRLIAGATDKPVRSFKPSEEDHPVRTGYLLLQSPGTIFRTSEEA